MIDKGSGYVLTVDNISSGDLAAVHRYVDDQSSSNILRKAPGGFSHFRGEPLRGEPARFYVSFVPVPSNKAQFLDHERVKEFRESDDESYRRGSQVTVGIDDIPFVHLCVRQKENETWAMELAERFTGQPLSFEQTERYWSERERNFDDSRVYIASFEPDGTFDYASLGERYAVDAIAWGTSRQFEEPNAYPRWVAEPSQLSVTIAENDGQWTLIAGTSTSYLEESGIDDEVANVASVQFRYGAIGLFKDLSVPGTCIVKSFDYSGPRFQVFEKGTDYDALVAEVTGNSSFREVGMSTISNSAARLSQFHAELLEVPGVGEEYAAKLIDAMKRVHSATPNEVEGKYLLGREIQTVFGGKED